MTHVLEEDKQFTTIICKSDKEIFAQKSRCVQWWLTPSACHYCNPTISCEKNEPSYSESKRKYQIRDHPFKFIKILIIFFLFNKFIVECVWQAEWLRLLDRLTEKVLIHGAEKGTLTYKNPIQDLVETIRCCEIKDNKLLQEILLLKPDTTGWNIKHNQKWTCELVKCYEPKY